MGMEINCSYTKYHVDLRKKYDEPLTCEESINKGYIKSFESKMRSKHNDDADSKLGTYYRVNPYLNEKLRAQPPNNNGV